MGWLDAESRWHQSKDQAGEDRAPERQKGVGWGGIKRWQKRETKEREQSWGPDSEALGLRRGMGRRGKRTANRVWMERKRRVAEDTEGPNLGAMKGISDAPQGSKKRWNKGAQGMKAEKRNVRS